MVEPDDIRGEVTRQNGHVHSSGVGRHLGDFIVEVGHVEDEDTPERKTRVGRVVSDGNPQEQKPESVRISVEPIGVEEDMGGFNYNGHVNGVAAFDKGECFLCVFIWGWLRMCEFSLWI